MPSRPKRLTANHWLELRSSRAAFRDGPDYDELDREAEAAGYDRDGMFRPWYRRHVMSLLALTGDSEAFAVMQRLNEIARAQREIPELTEALREWVKVTELIARVRR